MRLLGEGMFSSAACVMGKFSVCFLFTKKRYFICLILAVCSKALSRTIYLQKNHLCYVS